MPLFRENVFIPVLMKSLSSQWHFTQNPNIAVMPNSAALLWAPFVCCCHGSLCVGLLNDGGDTLVHKMTASSNKKLSVDSVDPIMAPAFILSWDGLLNTSFCQKAFLLLLSSSFSALWHLHVYVRRKLSTFYSHNPTGMLATPIRLNALCI